MTPISGISHHSAGQGLIYKIKNWESGRVLKKYDFFLDFLWKLEKEQKERFF